MGAWGPAIFSDDLASDVCSEFREYIGDGLSPEDATAKLLTDYQSSLDDVEERPVFWLALAATQWNMGRLQPKVLEEALRAIDSGEDLKRWDNDPKPRKVLEELRAKLNSPQPDGSNPAAGVPD